MPPEERDDHKTREEGEIAPLDALYPTMRVSSDGEKQQTHNRMTAMHEITYQEAVKNKTYQENRSSAKKVMMKALLHLYQQCFSAWSQPQQQTIGVFSAHNIHEGPGLLHDF